MCSTRLPKLIAFDLDYTLWDLWIDTHVDGPLHRKAQRVNEVLDRNDHPISFYRDVADIFHKIRAHRFADEGDAEDKVVIAVCSRTHAPDLARQCLNLLLVPPPHNSEAETAPPTAAITFFDELEIYPGSKLTHFKRLHKRSRIPYEEMLFFDDERRNGEVEKLGVTFIHVPTGLNHKIFEDGLERWQKRRSDS
ncbi:magnesium-dependent phosphatase-1 [Coprinellus micaceus]|uniref:Magnesium-dependent phosphatase-1 n=1 Tax=Coprinellus micaceus TaxID=71717 RepID=A0A4Y7SV90_COPMI|nr:magnesium-dependent phosphatase-1 [Coprinellus micaceus]TEB26404.1 magnesium-dependent phosphatase-1 [Coprinellus micaceus]